MKKRKRNKLFIRSIIFRQYFAEITLMINSGNFPLLRFSNNCFLFKKIQLISCSTLVKNSSEYFGALSDKRPYQNVFLMKRNTMIKRTDSWTDRWTERWTRVIS